MSGNHSSDDSDDASPLPDCLTSSTGKLVYLYVLYTGATTVSAIKTRLDLPSMTVLSVLRILEDKGLVETSGTTVEPSTDAADADTETPPTPQQTK